MAARLRNAVIVVVATALGCVLAVDALAQGEKVDASRLFGAIVKVSTHAIPQARSSTTLGAEREGTGVVIGDNGLILTIGYLIVEADDVSVIDSKGRTLS